MPYITVVAANETDGVTSMVRIEGPADAPEVTFTSVPELPQEEVLAWLLFGRGLQTISVLQAAELANAVAVLAGRGGEGIIGKLRRGFGFDDLDVTTAEDGTALVTAGKIDRQHLYRVEVDQTGKTRINLNLDLRKGVTVKGRVGSDGQSGIGVYLERDQRSGTQPARDDTLRGLCAVFLGFSTAICGRNQGVPEPPPPPATAPRITTPSKMGNNSAVRWVNKIFLVVSSCITTNQQEPKVTWQRVQQA